MLTFIFKDIRVLENKGIIFLEGKIYCEFFKIYIVVQGLSLIQVKKCWYKYDLEKVYVFLVL